MRPIPSTLSRRSLLAAAAAAMTASQARAAEPFFRGRGLPIGIQLYTLGPDVAADLDGTLAAVAKIGFRSVELAGFGGRTPAQMKAALDRAGLSCVSAHVQPRARGADGGLDGDLSKVADGLAAVGVKTAVMPIPYIPDRLVARPAPGEGGGAFLARMLSQMTADDWRMNADFLNEKAAILKTSGLALAYHNHNPEFAPVGATTGMDILLDRTEPGLVAFELDVGWVKAAGADPLAMLAARPGRFTLMHVKDVKASTQPNFALRMDPTEVGSGVIDWARLLPAAYRAGVRNFYVEQEPPFSRPRLEAAKISHDYLAGVTA